MALSLVTKLTPKRFVGLTMGALVRVARNCGQPREMDVNVLLVIREPPAPAQQDVKRKILGLYHLCPRFLSPLNHVAMLLNFFLPLLPSRLNFCYSIYELGHRTPHRLPPPVHTRRAPAPPTPQPPPTHPYAANVRTPLPA